MSNESGAGRLAFPAMLVGSAALAFGPWMVRLADAAPIASAFWRLTLALPILAAMAVLKRQGADDAPEAGVRPARIGHGALAALAMAGLAFAADLAFWHIGILQTTLANAVLIGNSASFMFAAWGFIAARTLPGRTASGAILLALAGMVLLMGRSYELSPQHLGGDLLCLTAAVFYALYLVLIGRARTGIRPLPALALSTAAGAAGLLAFILATGAPLLPGHWWPLIILALSSQLLGQGLIVYALGHLSPLVAGLCLLIQPVIAATIGAMAYGEMPGGVELVGAVMIATALILVRLPGRRGSNRAGDRLSNAQE